MSLFGTYRGTAAPVKRAGRKLPKRTCPKCKRLVSVMSNVTRDELRAHKCVPVMHLCDLRSAKPQPTTVCGILLDDLYDRNFVA